MNKKLISCILVAALLNLVGCYSLEAVSPGEYKRIEKERGKPESIQVETGDDKEYHFVDLQYTIENDTLIGTGLMVVNNVKQPFGGKIPLANITSIKVSEFDSHTTVIVILGVVVLVLPLVYFIASRVSWANKNK